MGCVDEFVDGVRFLLEWNLFGATESIDRIANQSGVADLSVGIQ